jgi:hypothetical protein
VATKNYYTSGKGTTNLLAMSSELCSLVNLITLPDEAKYAPPKIFNVLISFCNIFDQFS